MTHGIPSTAELIAAVREYLEQDVMPATEGRLQFHARVAANVLAQVERELALGPPADPAADAALCDAIRAGEFDTSLDQLARTLRPGVVAKLRIANPRHLLPEDR
jgi:Domain of unknown function (DUF6285)